MRRVSAQGPPSSHIHQSVAFCSHVICTSARLSQRAHVPIHIHTLPHREPTLPAMEEAENSQSLAQAADHGRELLERYWRGVIDDQYKRAEEKLLALIDTGMERAAERMAELATLVGAQGQQLSMRLSPNVPIGEHLNKRLAQAATAHLRSKYRLSMSPPVREVAIRPISPSVRPVAPPVRAVETQINLGAPRNAAGSAEVAPNQGRVSGFRLPVCWAWRI